MDVISNLDLSSLSPGLIDDLEAFMAPVGDGCYGQPVETHRDGGHQLPESPPDSGSENPYSPSENQVPHTIVTQSVLGQDYMLVHDIPTHDMLQQNGEYMYEELKTDNLDHEVLRGNLSDVVVLPQDPGIVELGIRSVRHDLGLSDIAYQNRYNQMRVDMSDLEQGMINPQLVGLGHEGLAPVYTNLQEPSTKKRKHSQDVSQVKCEPAAMSPSALPRPAPPSVDGSEAGDEAPLQCIRFAPFQQSSWGSLYDCNLKPLPAPSYVVSADKGFNFSAIDEAFVCQKKNHFQVTCQMQVQGEPMYVKTSDGFKKISKFCIHFYGVKAEDTSQEVRIEQSQSDRTKKPFHPVPVELRRDGTKITVGRLHFAETTNNNMRKKGRPNPEQRHFQLVVALRAHSVGSYMLAAQASDRIIVRASNPGQFESDCSESWWQRGVADNSLHFSGKVGINTDRPDEACVINGNLKVMGHIVHPSDARAKHNIQELDTAQQLKNVQSIRVVKFNYDPSFAEHSGLLGFDPTSSSPPSDTGVIAQEVRGVLPEAVREAGDVALPDGHTIHKFLVVNKDRIFMENLGAVKELCKVAGHLESRIDQLEKMNRRLCKTSLKRRDSSRSSVSNDSRYSATSASSKSLSDGNASIDQIRDIARSIRRHECCHKLSHNSPKYTRKQCKNCHNNHSKYGKYYHQNKTCVRYQAKDKNEDGLPSDSIPTYIETKEKEMLPEEKHSPVSKEKDTCLWLREEGSFACGNTKLAICCGRNNRFGDESTELISNKFLQIVITILIFIMAVCLVVMSALYFREHQELLTMKDIRLHEKFNYPHYGKFNTRPDHNQIQNLKPSQHPAAKKTAKEKAPPRTTEHATVAPPEPPPHTLLTTPPPARNYVKNVLNIEEPAQRSAELPVSVTRASGTVGNTCSYALNTDNELDPECQSSCSLDPPQTYDNQEPLERTNSEKIINETYSKPADIKERKLPIIPVTPEKNLTETLIKGDNESFKARIHDEIVAESNLLDPNKQNVTENSVRLKREVRSSKAMRKRETNDALRASSEEMTLAEQSDEENLSQDCDTISIGLSHASLSELNLFTERPCGRAIHNYTYSIPLSRCLTHKYIHLNIRSEKLRLLRLCSLQCGGAGGEGGAGEEGGAACGAWRARGGGGAARLELACRLDARLVVRAVYRHHQDLCSLVPEQKTHFLEFNFRVYRDCHN